MMATIAVAIDNNRTASIISPCPHIRIEEPTTIFVRVCLFRNGETRYFVLEDGIVNQIGSRQFKSRIATLKENNAPYFYISMNLNDLRFLIFTNGDDEHEISL